MKLFNFLAMNQWNLLYYTSGNRFGPVKTEKKLRRILISWMFFRIAFPTNITISWFPYSRKAAILINKTYIPHTFRWFYLYMICIIQYILIYILTGNKRIITCNISAMLHWAKLQHETDFLFEIFACLSSVVSS